MPGPKLRGNIGGTKHAFGTIKRLMSELFKMYKSQLILVGICLVVSAISTSAASIYIVNMLENIVADSVMEEVFKSLLKGVIVMGCVYLAGIVARTVQGFIMAHVSQNFLNETRIKMFNKMQNLPIKYFDQNTHGDIMSHYTNDIDTLRQLVSESLPTIVQSSVMVVVLLVVMLYYSLWLSLIVFACVALMLLTAKKVGGNSAKYFIRHQKSLGETEGFIEEMMHGQKVVKVFCHEEASEKDFDEVNGRLFEDAYKANAYSNMLGPIMGNLGNIMYVLLAFIGSVMVITESTNVGLMGIAKTKEVLIPIVVGFLTMGRQFTNQVSMLSQQINYIVMALAGAERIFSLMDEQPETDDGYVTLVNAEILDDGVITESEKRTGKWAWKHPHTADGSVTYTELKGDIQMVDVDFGYVPDKIVLHDVSLYAKPGQKVAFVGATGAGKTTITNLLNRFYDIADGKIRYDGININKIKKDDLRRSLGMVLQDTNLFTGTIMDNIRYGKLDATDEECVAAAKLANAHDFITRLPDGYNTLLENDGANLSQGQRQLLSIARAAVANAPVMIMDEATSSIDTRTEALVQKGTDELMKGRTVFVIAHRLSTVQNSDVIMVLDHGVIIERGSHKELIAKRGRYYQLYTGAFELE